MRRFSMIVFGLLASAAQADTECVNRYLSSLDGASTHYRANYQGMGTEVERKLSSSEGGQWVLNQNLDLMLVALDETSVLKSGAKGVETLRYRFEQTGMGKRTLEIRAEESSSKVYTQYKDKSGEYEWQSGLVDSLSHILQIQLERACDLTSGDQINLSIAKRSGVKPYTYTLQGKETLELPVLGSIEVELWTRLEGETEDRLWLAPELNYQMIRFSHKDGDEQSDLLIKPQ